MRTFKNKSKLLMTHARIDIKVAGASLVLLRLGQHHFIPTSFHDEKPIIVTCP